jgi:glutamate transport system substrate-binding protein
MNCRLRGTADKGVRQLLVIPTAADSGSLLSQRLTKPEFALGSKLRDIQERGFLRVAIMPESAGFCSPNPKTGKFEGIDVMIARRMAQGIFGGTMFEVRPHVEFVETTMSERLTKVIDGEADLVVAALAATAERRKIADFTRSYYGTALTVVVRNDRGIESISDLKRSRLVAVDGSIDLEFAQRNEISSNIVIAESLTEMADILARGDADAAMSAAVHLDSYADAWGNAASRLPVEFDSFQYAVAVRKGDDDFCEFLDVQMNDVIHQGYVAIAAACARR